MSVLFVSCIILIVLYIIFHVATILALGQPPKDGDIINNINHEIPNGVSLNPYSKSILRIGKMKGFVSTVPIPGLLIKYYINGVGVIPIWYESHKMIEQLYKDEESN